MEVVEAENVKVPNSLIVKGLTQTEVDEELFEYLKQYGQISRIIKATEAGDQAIVEFESGAAVETLEESLPFDRVSDANPEIVHHVDALANVYSAEKGTGITGSFLSELKGMAKLSGKSFETVLQDELNRITNLVGTPKPTAEKIQEIAPTVSASEPAVETPSDTDNVKDPDVIDLAEPSPDVRTTSITTPDTGLGHSLTTVKPPPDHLNPPEMQRLIVEHVVKSTDLSSHVHSVKLRTFSGRLPCPTAEVDYDTWRSSVEFYLADPAFPKGQLVRKIVDSLLAPAATVVKSLGPHSSPRAYLDLLNSAYDIVKDGDDLFAEFLNINQNSGEKPSNYLHRLQTAMNKVVKVKAISPTDSDRQLLRQFCRGCWNNTLINTLQLEQKKDKPPTFAELLLLLRTEEDKQTAKANRMKQHLGFSKAKTQAQAQSVCVPTGADYDLQAPQNDSPPAINQLQKQIIDLQAQIAALSYPKDKQPSKPQTGKQKPKPKQKEPARAEAQPEKPVTATKKPKPWYCFQCGEDGHIASSCNDPPNTALVNAKKKVFKERLQAWEKANPTDVDPSLNE